ncbi:MAG: hypothetical protein J6Y24_02950 [Bacteroidales bacterium]|nr:hypothetical protein [Bacteroidales bacterium]
MKRKFLLFGIMSLLCANSYAQSRSSYDASFFEMDGQKAAIEPGKGLNIVDPFAPTRPCFTSDSRDASLLKKQGTTGAKTDVKVFYTKNEYEYNMFESSNASGTVSYLNVASLSASELQKKTTFHNSATEKLIFIGTIDFGDYFYPDDPVFTPEAQKLLDEGKYDAFKMRYGTHFVSGIGKASKVIVELTLNSDETGSSTSQDLKLGAKGRYQMVDLSFKVGNTEEVSKKFKERKFQVDIKLEGPQLATDAWKRTIDNLGDDGNQNLISAVSDYMKDQLNKMQDEDQALIVRYFFTDFTLYGCEGIKWNKPKENKLSSINKNVLDCYSIINLAQENIDINPIDNPNSSLSIIPDFSEQNHNYPYDQLKKQIVSVNPEWESLIASANELIEKLKTQYDNCSDITCAINESCCGNVDYTSQVKQLFAKYNSINDKIGGYADEWIKKLFENEQRLIDQDNQRVKKAKFTVINKSKNPYNIYINGNFKKEIPGGYQTTWTVNLGTYEIKAVQKSGYYFEASVYDKTVILIQEGQEVNVSIGYDD